jgi:pseudaminic acid cytidylyltransferase
VRVAVIPARGGSRRIPRKNVRPFCGKPVIAWVIEAARASSLFEHVLVSTDDAEIRDVALQSGAECPFMRPPELADDYTVTSAVIGHATRWALDAGWDVDAVCCMYATAPLIDTGDLKRGLAALTSGDWAFAIAATTFAAPIQRAFTQRPDGGLEMYFPDQFATRTQDLPATLHDAAQFYWGRPDAWIDGRRMFDRWSVPVVIPRWRVQDIDEPEDWARAESVFRELRNGGPSDRPEMSGGAR